MIAAHDVYHPQAGTWHGAAPLPLPRDHLAVVAADKRIHVIGGRLGSPAQRSGQHDVYDPAAEQWSSAAPLPTLRSGVAGVLYSGLILVLGGELPPDHTFPEKRRIRSKGGQVDDAGADAAWQTWVWRWNDR